MAPLQESHSGGDVEALVLDHRRLARQLAQRYIRNGEQREDLEQAAYLGLVKAARRFEPDRGVAFTTFAVPTVLGELRRFCRDTRWSVHVPRPIQENVQALRKVEDELTLVRGRSPSVAEVAQVLGWSQEEVLDAREAAGCLAQQSLNATARSADGTIGEAIECIGDYDRGFVSVEQRDELQRAFALLPARERRALRLRGEGGCSTPAIARHLGISTPQAARLVAQAIRNLRDALDETTVAGSPRPERFVRLADADPDLFAGVEQGARRGAVAPRERLAPGEWQGPRAEGLGLLVLSGALLRTVTVDDRPRAELIGPGDVLRDADGERDAQWRAVTTVDLAVLEDSLCRWPSVVEALLRRASDRSHALAIQLAITDLRRAEDRVLAFFRVLADRWGTRVPDGIAVSMPLTHDMIATIVGVHRPTVTTTLRRLETEHRLRRRGRDCWLVIADDAPQLPLAA
jgi:RNA polymerase sigma-B factor